MSSRLYVVVVVNRVLPTYYLLLAYIRQIQLTTKLILILIYFFFQLQTVNYIQQMFSSLNYLFNILFIYLWLTENVHMDKEHLI